MASTFTIFQAPSNDKINGPIVRNSCGFNIYYSPACVGKHICLAFNGIAENAPALGISTTWKNAGGAFVTGFLNIINDNMIVKLLAPSYKPMVPTGKWTQEILDSGTPLSLSIQFRSYYIPTITQTSDYMTVIKHLAGASLPESYSLLNLTKNYENIIDGFKNDPNNKIKSAFSEAGNGLSQVKDVAGDTIGLAGSIVDAGEGWKDNVNAKYQKLSTDATNLGKQVDNILKTLGQTARGTATFTIDYGSIFKACHNKSNVDWILNDWSMKPSMNFINIGNKAKPIYIDFTVNFETNCILSERDLANMIQ